jgi:hypothetical protein
MAPAWGSTSGKPQVHGGVNPTCTGTSRESARRDVTHCGQESRFANAENTGSSRTALAYARACHQVADRPTIFTDALPAHLLGLSADELIELSQRIGERVGTVIGDQGRRLFFAAGARFAEDR